MNDFLTWWQYLPYRIDPVIVQIGWFKLQYYGLMYLVAFGCVQFLVNYRLKTEPRFELTVEDAGSLTMAMIVGLIIGARLGYALIYNLPYFLRHPLEIFLPFSFSGGFRFTGISGMSYHGGLIGAILAATYYIRKHRLRFWEMADLYIPAIPLGYTFGRLGNFINGELYGRVTTAAVGMFFPMAPDGLRRHPSQLYEAFFEGVFLFAVLWSVRNVRWARGKLLGLYLIGYGSVRFVIEIFREPDAHIGFVMLSLTTGQILCLLMILAGGVLIRVANPR